MMKKKNPLVNLVVLLENQRLKQKDKEKFKLKYDVITNFICFNVYYINYTLFQIITILKYNIQLRF